MIIIKNQKKLGNSFVLDVAFQLNHYLIHNQYSPQQNSDLVLETTKYIVNMFPEYSEIISKFEFPNPDKHPDLKITISGIAKRINLFRINGGGNIQPKNLGAQSFFKTYFESEELQQKFNMHYSVLYEQYLGDIYQVIFNKVGYSSSFKNELRRHVEKLKKSEKVKFHQRKLLFLLREYAFDLFKHEYNLKSPSIKKAFQTLLMEDEINIVSRTLKNNEIKIELFNPNIDFRNDVKLFKKGNGSIEIVVGDISLILRFKFESSPLTSIKLATGHSKVLKPAQEINNSFVSKFQDVIAGHSYKKKKNTSNAIGKCNEAIIYTQFIQMNPSIAQVDEKTPLDMIKNYMDIIPSKSLENLLLSSKVTWTKLIEFMNNKYPNNIITSIQLVPESYLKDRLDNSDMKIILYYESKYIEEGISLKAIKNNNNKITVKNPGAGTILEEQYFYIGSLRPLIAETKALYENNILNHTESLERVSEKLGDYLVNVNNNHLERGLKAILGTNPIAVTFYEMNDAIVLEHAEINSKIKVLKQTPSKIQTTLDWNNSMEKLTLRMKFSGGQNKGWTSLKLACEYQIKK